MCTFLNIQNAGPHPQVQDAPQMYPQNTPALPQHQINIPPPSQSLPFPIPQNPSAHPPTSGRKRKRNRRMERQNAKEWKELEGSILASQNAAANKNMVENTFRNTVRTLHNVPLQNVPDFSGKNVTHRSEINFDEKFSGRQGNNPSNFGNQNSSLNQNSSVANLNTKGVDNTRQGFDKPPPQISANKQPDHFDYQPYRNNASTPVSQIQPRNNHQVNRGGAPSRKFGEGYGTQQYPSYTSSGQDYSIAPQTVAVKSPRKFNKPRTPQLQPVNMGDRNYQSQGAQSSQNPSEYMGNRNSQQQMASRKQPGDVDDRYVQQQIASRQPTGNLGNRNSQQQTSSQQQPVNMGNRIYQQQMTSQQPTGNLAIRSSQSQVSSRHQPGNRNSQPQMQAVSDDLVPRVEMFLEQMQNFDQMSDLEIKKVSRIVSFDYLSSLQPQQLKQVSWEREILSFDKSLLCINCTCCILLLSV